LKSGLPVFVFPIQGCRHVGHDKQLPPDCDVANRIWDKRLRDADRPQRPDAALDAGFGAYRLYFGRVLIGGLDAPQNSHRWPSGRSDRRKLPGIVKLIDEQQGRSAPASRD
jgi:hypothetical protein